MGNVNSIKKPSKSPVKGIIGALFAAVGRMLRNVVCGVFNPRKWLLIIFITGLSTLLNWLIASGEMADLWVNPVVSKTVPIISYILFAGGGISVQLSELIGGLFGKTVCAAFLAALLSGKLKGTGKGIKLFAGSLIGKYARPMRAICGIGLSFLVFSLIAGDTGVAGTMVGLSGTVMILKALGGAPGVLRSLSASFNSYKKDSIRHADITGMNAFMAGAAGGFALVCLLNLKYESKPLLIAGLVMFGAGFILKSFSKKNAATAAVLVLILIETSVPVFAGGSVRKISNPPTYQGSGLLRFNYREMNGELTLVQGGGNVIATRESCVEDLSDGYYLYERYRGSLNPGQNVYLSFASEFPDKGSKSIYSHVYMYRDGDYIGETLDSDYAEISSYGEGKYSYAGSDSHPWIDIGYDYSGIGNVDGLWLNFLFTNGDDMYEVDIFLGNVPDEELEECFDYDYQDVEEVYETENGEYELGEIENTESDFTQDIPLEVRDEDTTKDPLPEIPPTVNIDEFINGSYPEGFFDLTPEEVLVLSAVLGIITAGIGAGAVTTLGAGKPGKTSQSSANGEPSEGDSYTLKDPATGAETLYNYDPSTGEWISADGRSVLNMDDVDRWKSDRQQDRLAADDAMAVLNDRSDSRSKQADAEARRLKEEYKKIAEESKIEKTAVRNGMYTTSEDELRSRLETRQEQNLRLQANAETALKHKENLVKAAEITVTAADMGVEALGKVTGPIGEHVVKNAYYAGKNLASNISDACVNKKDMGSAVRKALGETIVDITQNEMGSKSIGYQFAANSAGDAYKKMLDAVDNGEDPVKAAAAGFISGSAKTGVGAAFDKYVDATKGATSVYAKHLKYNVKVLSGLRTNYEQGIITKKVYEGAATAVRNSTATLGRAIKITSGSAHFVTDKVTEAAIDSMVK